MWRARITKLTFDTFDSVNLLAFDTELQSQNFFLNHRLGLGVQWAYKEMSLWVNGRMEQRANRDNGTVNGEKGV